MPLSGQVIGKRTKKTGERARLGRGVGDMRGFVLEYVNDVAMSGRKTHSRRLGQFAAMQDIMAQPGGSITLTRGENEWRLSPFISWIRPATSKIRQNALALTDGALLPGQTTMGELTMLLKPPNRLKIGISTLSKIGLSPISLYRHCRRLDPRRSLPCMTDSLNKSMYVP